MYGTDSEFGRDQSQSEHAFLEAEEMGMEIPSSNEAMLAVVELDRFQVKADDPIKGIKAGQILHEYKFDNYQTLLDEGWYYNEQEKRIENHDSADSTPGWIETVTKIAEHNPELVRPHRESIMLACEYVLRNSIEHNNLSGFTNDIGNGVRQFTGIAQRGWKDSHDSLLFNNGLKPKDGEPIDLPEVTALTWIAELHAADWLMRESENLTNEQKIENVTLANRLRADAAKKKEKFNDPNEGFLKIENGKALYAEAIGVNPETNTREQLPGISSDIIFALRLPYKREDGTVEYIIDSNNIADVVDTIRDELFIPGVGLATYSGKRDIVESETHYHRSRGKTFWTDKGYMAANALIDLGIDTRDIKYLALGLEIGDTAGEAVLEFGTPLELYVEKNGKRSEWVNPKNQVSVLEMKEGEEIETKKAQKGCHIQGWVVAEQAAYLARRKLLKSALPKAS